MINPGLKDKVVLVTGGNNPHGIGAATARAFAAQGASVFIHYFRHSMPEHWRIPNGNDSDTPGIQYFFSMQARSADDIVQEIRNLDGKAVSHEANLADPDVVPELFDIAEREFGQVDILVNNAADYSADSFLPENEDRHLWEGGPLISTITAESHDLHFAVNSRAAALLTAEFARRHIGNNRSWGRIINVSADCAWGCPDEISYRASKYAIESYSRSAAAELGPYGITVNIVSPGPIQSGYISPEGEKALIGDIPLRRIGQPEDIADTVVFLASEQARWVTGQLIFVHGGHRMALGR